MSRLLACQPTPLDGFRVLVDSCHNAAGMRMLGDFVDRLAERPKGGDVVAHRRIGVIARPGDLVVLCADRVDEIVDELQARVRPAPAAGGRA